MSAEEVTRCTSAVASLWNDESVTVEAASVKSDWVWRHLVFGSVGGYTNPETEDRRAWIRDSVFKRASLMFLPPRIEHVDRLSSYTEWVEGSIVNKLRYANSDLIDHALASISDNIDSRDADTESLWLLLLAAVAGAFTPIPPKEVSRSRS